MEELSLSIPVSDKQITCALRRKKDAPATVCFVLGHGASGDFNSGNLPAIAESLAAAGFAVLRYNASGQLPGRIKILQERFLMMSFDGAL